ncbi:hypothetical protein CEXT_539691 [Caerostris extrusa]|uniref:Uncharacterized protein n=1 Tax=Caerostris extrusa TaxID=172846 RepID=A0AAV4W652_CAEEX|nr:hypothetical protein CEXT_539691 [Caerostris extrusa]
MGTIVHQRFVSVGKFSRVQVEQWRVVTCMCNQPIGDFTLCGGGEFSAGVEIGSGIGDTDGGEGCELLVGAGGHLPCNILRCRPEVVVMGSFDTNCVCTLFEEELFGKLDFLAAHHEVASGTVEL